MHTTPRRLPRTTALLLATALTVLLVTPSCGSSDSHSDPPSTTSTPDTTIAPPDTTHADPKAEVRALLERYWPIWLAANNPPNPDDPHLKDVLSGDALATTTSKIRERAKAGQSIRLAENGRFKHQLIVATTPADPNKFTAIECVIDDTQLVDTATGNLINGATATYELLRDFVRDASGNWTINKSRQQSRTDGVAGCGLQLQP